MSTGTPTGGGVAEALLVHEFLRSHRDAILRDWKVLVSASPNGVKLDDSVLWGHLPEFLEELSAWLQRGEQPGTAKMRAAALSHTLLRLDHSYQLAQVIRELGLLRTVLLRLLLEAEAVEGVDPVRGADRIVELARLNAGLDVATTDVVEQFIVEKDHRNLAERKRAEEARGESERRLRLHIESTPVAVVEYDHHFRITGWNPAAEAIFGWSADEAMGQQATLIIPESARPHVDEVFRRLLGRKSGQRSVNENVTKDGRIITCDWNNTVLVSSGGEVIGVASMALDVSERVRAEGALAQREHRLQAILRTALDGFYAVDGAGALVEVNNAYCEMSGYPPR